MKSQSFCKCFPLIFSLIFFNACFGGGIDPKDDPIQPGGGSNAASANENGAKNNVGLNEENPNATAGNQNAESNEDGGADEMATNNADEGNFLNNAANNEAEMFNNNPQAGNNFGQKNGNQSNNDFGLAANGGDGAQVNGNLGDILQTPAPDDNQTATDNEALEPTQPGDSILAPVAGDPTGPTTIRSGGVVRYVLQGGSKLYDKPEGQTLHKLEQGDHPLVNEEGEWSRTSDGFYVPASTLTSSPIPRAKTAKNWK